MKKDILVLAFIIISSSLFSQKYIVKLAGVSQGKVYIANVKHAIGLTVEGPGDPVIIKFRISATINSLEESAYSNSDKFTTKQKEIIRRLFSKKKLYIDKIRIKVGTQIISLPSKKYILSYTDVSRNLCVLAGNSSGGLLSYSEIEKDPYIKLIDQSGGKVTQFDFSVNLAGFNYVIRSKGNKLSPKMLGDISKLKRRGRFEINNIKILTNRNSIIIANQLVYRIK